jgi:hypothetical protein
MAAFVATAEAGVNLVPAVHHTEEAFKLALVGEVFPPVLVCRAAA